MNKIYLKNHFFLISLYGHFNIFVQNQNIRFSKSKIQNLFLTYMKQTQELKKECQKGIIIVSGVPGSGKSYFAKVLCQKLLSKNRNTKIFSSDNLQAFFYENPYASVEETHQIFFSKDWDHVLGKYQLNKQIFDEKAWNLSRKTIENPLTLDLLLKSCQTLIIEDELALRSQRKAFRRYCFEREVKYLEIQIQVSLQEALSNNSQRGSHFPLQKVSQQIIKKSFQKYEHNEDSIVLTRTQMPQFLNSLDIASLLKQVQIQDNYSEYLLKKSLQHEFTEKELDENGLRKLINLIMKDEKESQKYFHEPIQSKEKAAILSQAKKLYLEKKRKVPFVEILLGLVSKEK